MSIGFLNCSDHQAEEEKICLKKLLGERKEIEDSYIRRDRGEEKLSCKGVSKEDINSILQKNHLRPDGDVQGEVLLEVADVLPHRRHLHLLVVLTLGTLDVKFSKNS